MRPTTAIAVTGAVAVLAATGAGLLLGTAGLVVGAALGAGLTLVAIRAVFLPVTPPPAAAAPRPSRPSPRFHRFEAIDSMVAWAQVSGRQFDYGARRLIRQLLAQRLAERHGIDLNTDPDAARTLVGARHWALLAPDAAPSRDEGVDQRTLDDLITMLEER
ncbi:MULTISPECIES: hypothetical protein [Micromonospora]|uniref:Uncharacterized protein n=1 Tax=Micromonospora solifontis TaxID=2487138 RepID=A0ABX9WEI1_9ACTN|nr:MULTISPECIES: hypothetical protein [Micromonospora]NES17003.1 hypothetical protein [Micromonospora sp. PPF5-17B]NES38416.1 hypothetical protein [Micromonospora solifontis]NES58716.1 hypothetical protein [Micromonospora sp. PPF5-6]RNL95831.1 hypothetical protein EFE23_20025 [Micromonospora solifontis]